VKRCPECAREIEESATTCDACAEWAASMGASLDAAPLVPPAEPSQLVEPLRLAEPLKPAESSKPAGSVAAPAARPRVGRRELVIGAVAIVGAGLVAFPLMLGRGASSSSVAAVATAPRTAARQPSTSHPSPTIIHQKWSAGDRARWLGNQRHGAAFELPADNIVQTWFGPVRPALIVRCTAKSIQTFVYTGSPMKIEPHAEGKTVTVSVDDEPVSTERWPDADDHDALFAPDGGAFAERLLHAQTLRFGYSPHNASDVVAQFHVSGLAEQIDSVAKECGPTK
jgi:hypothetical protein